MAHVRRLLDAGSVIVMAVTLVLFVLALFLTGVGHDLLLEAGVFLVSTKLMIMSYRLARSTYQLHEEVRSIRTLLQSREGGPGGRDRA
jgi:hypothetical protein